MASFALTSGFFDNLDNDRVYDAHNFNMVVKLLAGRDGIYGTFNNSGLTITFPNGLSFVQNGRFGYTTQQVTITLTNNATNYIYSTTDTANRTVKLFYGTSVPSGSVELMRFVTSGGAVVSNSAPSQKGFNFTNNDVFFNASQPAFASGGKIWAPQDTRNSVTTANADTTYSVTKNVSGSSYIDSTSYDVYPSRNYTRVAYHFSNTLIEDMTSQRLTGLDSIPANANIISVTVKTSPSANVKEEKIFYYNSSNQKKSIQNLNSENLKSLLEAGHRGDIGWHCYAYIYGSSTKTVTYENGSTAPATYRQTMSYSDSLKIIVTYSVTPEISNSIIGYSRIASSTPGTATFNVQPVAVYFLNNGTWTPVEVFSKVTGSWTKRDIRTD